MGDFSTSYELTAHIEGGYVNDLSDHGGETYAGISRKSNPTWSGWLLIDGHKNQPNFPDNLASDSRLPPLIKRFYELNYWDVNSLDKINDQRLCNELYDIGVNMGTSIAAEFLQRALNIANVKQKLWLDLKVDKQIGALSIEDANKAKSLELLKLVGALQGARYIEIVERDPTQEIFIASWMQRYQSY